MRIAYNFFDQIRIDSSTKIEVKRLEQKHWSEISTMYLRALDNGEIISQDQYPIWEEWYKEDHDNLRWIATLKNEKIYGWGSLKNSSSVPNLNGVMEISIYMVKGAKGFGAGEKIMEYIKSLITSMKVWTLQANILEDDLRLVKLFLKHNFRQVGIRERYEKINGKWYDTILLEYRISKN